MNYLRSLLKRQRGENNYSMYEDMFHVRLRGVKSESYFDALKWHGAFRGRRGESKYFNPEGSPVPFREATYNGDELNEAMILFPADIKREQDEHSIAMKLKELLRNSLSGAVREGTAHEEPGSVSGLPLNVRVYSTGTFFRRKYFDKESRNLFSAESLCLELIGISFKELFPVACKLAEEFKVSAVMIKHNRLPGVFLMDIGQ